MNLLSKNLIIFLLIACIAAVFVFHWFFISGMMLISECLSSNCVYVSPQAILQEANYVLFFLLAAALFIAVLLAEKPFDDEFKRLPGKFALKKAVDTFSYKLNFWLKILEKRDPENRLGYGAWLG